MTTAHVVAGDPSRSGSRPGGPVPRMVAMGTSAGLRRWTQAHPLLLDGALAVVLALAVLPGLADDHGPRDRPHLGTTLFLVLAALTLAARRSHPLAVWALSLAFGATAVLLSDGRLPLALPTFLALYTLGRSAQLARTVLATAVTVVVYALTTAASQGAWLDDRGDFPALATLALSGAAAAVGVAVRSQQEALAAATARAHQAELTREEEAQRRVTDERVRIAHELHDIVAHHVSVINVQAGVARHLMDASPEQARTALGLVREASKTVLSEMSAVVGLLRTPEEDAPVEPAPGLSRIGALVENVRRAGLQLTWTSTGEPWEPSALSDLTAYRVVQESLTNAVKYGSGAAGLVISYGAEVVAIDVRNPVDGTRRTEPGGGHGLIGMRERVEAVRGVLVTGLQPDGTFAVHAEIPR